MFQKPTQQLAKVGLGQSFAGGRGERTGVRSLPVQVQNLGLGHLVTC